MDLLVGNEIRDLVVVVTVAGDVDVFSAPHLRENLDRNIATGHLHLVVDLQDVTFMDSTGMGVLVNRLKLLRLHGGSVRVVCTVPRILRLFAITGLDVVLPTYETVDEAVAATHDVLQSTVDDSVPDSRE